MCRRCEQKDGREVIIGDKQRSGPVVRRDERANSAFWAGRSARRASEWRFLGRSFSRALWACQNALFASESRQNAPIGSKRPAQNAAQTQCLRTRSFLASPFSPWSPTQTD